MPYSYLLTRMKSPTSSVGTIDPDGILNGSTTNDRTTNTTRMTGKKLAVYSSHHGCRSFLSRTRARGCGCFLGGKPPAAASLLPVELGNGGVRGTTALRHENQFVCDPCNARQDD